MANEDYRPRVSIDVTEEQLQQIQKIPWGIRKYVLAKMLDDLIELFEKHGTPVLGAILNGNVRYGKEYSDGKD